MVIDYAAQLAEVVRATGFLSAGRFTWFGVPSPPLAAGVRRALPAGAARHYLLYQLQGQLYRDFYRPGGATPAEARPAPARTGSTPFVEQLAAANSGQGGWEPGWRVHAAGEGRSAVSRDGLFLWASAAEYRGAPGAAPDGVQVRFPKHLPAISPGFYMALGDAPFAGTTEPLVRLYWHVDAGGALRLMTLATRGLNEAAIPFRLKVVNDPAHFTRCDAAVLYVRQADYAAVAEVVRRIYPPLNAQLRPRIPPLTKGLAPGLALAEDPGPGTSFGLHRCALLAEALLRAHEAGHRRPAERLQQVIAHFHGAGIAIATPFLQPGSRDDYTIAIVATPPRSPAVPEPAAPLDGLQCLQMAEALGQRLVREAVWHGEQCNWMGAALQVPTGGGTPQLVYRALGPDLYEGTSGIALFLAELGAITQDPATRRTAAGALGQALAQAATVPPAARLSLYTGWIGLSLAALRVGQLDPPAGWIERAGGLLAELRPDYGVGGYDVLSGSAGAILGLLVLAETLADSEWRTYASELGAGLVAAAEEQARGIAWRSPGRPKTAPPLTGLSHGAAGIGYALLELYQVTGESTFRVAAEGAYAYEQDLFDAAAGNWPDLRTTVRWSRTRRPGVYATFWCHGAPGIALTRLRAYEILDNPRYKQEAVAGIETTCRWVQATLGSGEANFSLCHGVSGNVEVLLKGATGLGYEEDRMSRLAQTVARAGISQQGREGRPWPCGVAGGETPGLLLGLAGIGLFYLRLYHPSTPPVLSIQSNMYTSPRPLRG